MFSCDVLAGFAVNGELTWSNVPCNVLGGKYSAEVDFCISGASYNVVRAVNQCGFNACLVGAVGTNDPLKAAIEADLDAQSISSLLLEMREKTTLASFERETGRGLSAKYPIREVPKSEIEALVQAASPKFQVVAGIMPDVNEVAAAKALLLPGYGIRVFTAFRRLLENRNLFLRLARASDWLVMNRHEAASFLGCQTEEICLDSLDPFLGLGASLVIVTCDGQGVLAADNLGWRASLDCYQAGKKIEEKGAGDCFLGFFLSAILSGRSQAEALVLANIAAGIKVTRPGTVNFPTFKEVLEASKTKA